MSGLVSGYSGIIAPPNLATNGGFGINQRSLFGVFAPIKDNDYIADCWKVQSTALDFCEADHSSSGEINFRGYGKKGQQLNIINRDSTAFGVNRYSTSSINNFTLTASVGVKNYKIPVSVLAKPRRHSGDLSYLASGSTYFPNNSAGKTKPEIVKTYSHSFNSQDLIQITLQEDGEFYFTLSHFGLFAGAFKNPPKYAPVPYADDLARCQRYYQKNTGLRLSGPIGRIISNQTRIFLGDINLITPMSSSPTVSVEFQSGPNVTLYQQDSSTELSDPTSNWLIHPQSGSNKGFHVVIDRPTPVSGYNSGVAFFDWTAEVV